MEVKQVKRTRLYREIVKQIKDLVREKTLVPGDQLLPERQLAEQLGVSRSALREALTALESMGLLEIAPRGGAFIKEVSMENFIEPLAAVMLKEREHISDLMQARKILEVEIVKLAAQNASKTDLYQIRQAAVDMYEDAKHDRDASAADVEFHLSIARASQNSVLINIMTMLSGLMKEAFGPRRRKILKDPDQVKYFCEQNFAIYEAIKNKEIDTAAALMYEHLTNQ